MSAKACQQYTPTGTPNPNDIDGDGIPNGQDPDVDGDGIDNINDPDVDKDGQHNSVDTDDDNDGTTDSQDATPGGYGTTQATWRASWGGSGPEPTNTPGPTSTPTQPPTPTPKLLITNPSPTQTEDRYISATPSMPTPEQCKAKLENWQGGTVTFNWEYKISKLFDSETDRTVQKTYTGTSTASGSNETTWYPNFASDFYGGDVTIKVSAAVDSKSYGPVTLENVYHIKGTNPGSTAAKSYIGTSPWYAQRIGAHEPAVTGAGAYCQFYTTTEYPVLSGDNGYGMFQLTDPSPTDTQVWNWKLNVDGGKSKISSCQTDFTDQQVQQWTQYNATYDPDVPGPQLATCNDIVFSITPTAEQKHYRDADAIKRYNGLGVPPNNHAYLVWQTNHWEYYFGATLNGGATIYYVSQICETSP